MSWQVREKMTEFCKVTSNPYGDLRAITLADTSFRTGSLRVTSYARPGKLFTANQTLMTTQVGDLKDEALKNIVDVIVRPLMYTRH